MKGKQSQSASKPISERASKGKAIWILRIFFSIFFLIGGGIFYAFFVRPMLMIMDAKNWSETPCTIISSQVGRHESDDGATFSVDVVYTYRINGREYQSDRYDFLDMSSSGYDSKAAIVARYPPGQRAACYVNPQDPTDAVMERGFVNDMYFALIPLVFLFIGAGGLVFTARMARKEKNSTQRTWEPRAMTVSRPTPSASDSFDASIAHGPVVLQATASPRMKLIGVTLFSVFWNGIVSIFVWQAYESWLTGDPEWFLIVFLIPFVLIGLGSIIGTGYYFLGLFNPRPKLIVSSDTVPLGGSLNLEWQMSGRAHIVQRLRIYLEGREEATYRRGTDTHTDRETFATIEIADTNTPSTISWSQAQLMIPRDTMHSFYSNNNKIVWSLHVHGDIKGWPDIEEEFEITVLPTTRTSRW